MFVAFVFLHHVVVLKANTCFKVVRTAFFLRTPSPSLSTCFQTDLAVLAVLIPCSKNRLPSPNSLNYCLTPAPIFTTKAEQIHCTLDPPFFCILPAIARPCIDRSSRPSTRLHWHLASSPPGCPGSFLHDEKF